MPLRLCYSPDGRTLALADRSGRICLWDTAANRSRATLAGQPEEAWSLSFSGDGRWLASGAANHRVAIWDANSGRPELDDAGNPLFLDGVAAAFAPDGRSLVTATPKALFCWDWPRRQVRQRLATVEGQQFMPTSLRISPDGKTLAAAFGHGVLGLPHQVLLWDLTSGTNRRLPGGHRDQICRLAFSPDGKQLASGSLDGTIKLWDLTAEQETVCFVPGSPVAGLAFAPDGRTLASGGSDGVIKFWHLATRQELFALDRHPGALCDLAFSPDGMTLATSGHVTDIGIPLIYLWSAPRGGGQSSGP